MRPIPRRAVSSGVVALLAGGGAVALPPLAQADTDPFVAELHYDNAGTDVGEAIEIQAAPGTDAAGWQVVLYNGANGAAYDTDPVPSFDAAGISVLRYPANGIQNGSPDGLALVRPDGTVAEFLSYEGVMTATGGPAAGLTSTDIGVAEAGTEPPGQSLQRIGGTWTGPLPETFGVVNGGGTGPQPGPDPEPAPPVGCDTEALPVGAVQGSGAATPLAGRPVVVRGTVVADLQDGGYDGFHVQDAGDGDPATSDGVFVYAPGAADVALGDVVTVAGTATEFNGLTQVAQVTGLVGCGTAPLPPAAPLSLPATSGQLESLEGMLVQPAQELTVTEVFNLNRFGEVVLSQGGRLVTPTQVAEPGDAARAVMASNAARRIVLDDGRTTNLAAAGVAPPYLTADDPVRVGDTLDRLQPVVLSYGFNAYRMQPADGTAEGTTFAATSPRTAAPAEVGGDIKVGAFNVLNYFVTFGGSARGAADEAAKERQEAKIVSAIRALGADVVALQEIENSAVTTPETPYAAVQELVGALNEAEGATVWDFVREHEASDAITNAIIFRTDGPVIPLGAPMVPQEGQVWANAREPLAQTFVARGDVFTVVANHFKSKSSGSGPGNTDAGDGQGLSNADRVAQARALVEFAAEVVRVSGDEDVVLLGDFNAYALEDPLDVLRAAGYTDLAQDLAPGDLSYVFNGESGSLDHSFASPSLAAKVTGLDVWNINAEESFAYQYNGFPAFYSPDPYRASDHNPEVFGLALVSDGPTCAGLPATLVGTEGRDVLRGTAGPDVIVGLGGSDVIYGLGGDDVICGGDGNDVLYGGTGDDRLFGERGNDVLFGGPGTDRLDGGPGRNSLFGG